MFQQYYPSQINCMPQLPSTRASSYAEFDAYRSRLEQETLLRQQVERRHAEAALLQRQQEKALLEERLHQAHLARQLEARVILEARQRREMERAEFIAREIDSAKARLRQHSPRVVLINGIPHLVVDRRESLSPITLGPTTTATQPTLPAADVVLSSPALVATPTASPPVDATPATAPIAVTPSTVIGAPAPAATPSPSEIDAAAKIQRHVRKHLLRRKNLAALDDLTTTFTNHQSTFVFPDSLVFAPTDPANVDNHPKLAFASVNTPVLAHEDALVNLLLKVDGLESNGDSTVKAARKTLVRQIEGALSALDSKKDAVWKQQSAVAKEVNDKVVEEDDAMMGDEQDSSPAQPVVDIAPSTIAVPSPHIPQPTAAAVPLTSESLASVPSHAPTRHARQSHRWRTTSSSASTTSDEESNSMLTQDETELMEAIIRRAEKLGEEVSHWEALERQGEQRAEEYVMI